MNAYSSRTWHPSPSRITRGSAPVRDSVSDSSPARQRGKPLHVRCLRSGPPSVGAPCWAGVGIRVVGLIVCSLAAASIVDAQERRAAEADAAIVQPFVSETTVLVLKVDTARIDLPDLADILASVPPAAKAYCGQILQQIAAQLDLLRFMVNDQPVYATLGIPISEKRVAAFAWARRPPPEAAAKLREFLRDELKADLHTDGDYVVAAYTHGEHLAELLAASPAVPREGIADAFESVAGYPAQVLLLPPSYVRRTVKELMPELPSAWGGGPSSVLTEGIQWAALGVDPAQLRAELVIQSATESAARDLAAHLPKMLRSASDWSDIDKEIPAELAQALLSWVDPKVEGPRVTIRIQDREKVIATLGMLAATAQAEEEKRLRDTNRVRFQKILIAIHNYHDTYTVFPPVDELRGEDGKHHLSWRVHILPFVGQPQLYGQFHLDEAWDSPHNRKLIAKMPDLYRAYPSGSSPEDTLAPGYTTFLAPVGEKTAFGRTEAPKFSDFTDGMSNTIVLVEVKPENAVPWTAPDDYAYDPKDPAAGLKIGADGGRLCGFADGSVKQLRRDLPPKAFLHLFQINDGNYVDF